MTTTEDFPGLIPRWRQRPGDDQEISTLDNLLRWHGLTAPSGEPWSRAMLSGLAGGIGFMLFTFEYQGAAPMLTVGCRRHLMPGAFLTPLLERAGIDAEIHSTGGAKAAAKRLEAALAADRPVICAADFFFLPHYGLPQPAFGMAPRHFGVVGRRGDDLWLDGGGPRPVRVDAAAFARARGAYKKSKYRLIDVRGAAEVDIAAGIRAAVADTVRGYREAPYKNFGGNFGLAGLEKWRRLLTDEKDKKGWPRLFADGEPLFRMRLRVSECVRRYYTPPLGGRPRYADFLEQAGALLGDDRYADAAAQFRASAQQWAALAERVERTEDAGFVEALALDARRGERLGSAPPQELRGLYDAQEALAKASAMALADDPALFADLAGIVGAIHALEADAVRALDGVN